MKNKLRQPVTKKIPVIDVETYGGKQVAIVNGKIVASGIDTEQVLEAAKKQIPGITWQDIVLVNVPKSLFVENILVPRILGREGLFAYFAIVFDEAKRRVVFLDRKKEHRTIDSLFVVEK